MSFTIGQWGEKIDLKIRQGSDFVFETNLYSGPNKVPMDLTGYAFRAEIRKAKGGPLAASFSFTVTGNKVKASLDETATAAITCGNSPDDLASRYVWAMDARGPDGLSFPLYFGDVKVMPQVVQWPTS